MAFLDAAQRQLRELQATSGALLCTQLREFFFHEQIPWMFQHNEKRTFSEKFVGQLNELVTEVWACCQS